MKMSDKIKDLTAELTIEKNKVNDCVLESKNKQKAHDSLVKSITKECKDQVKKVQDDTKNYTKGLKKRLSEQVKK